MSLVPVCGGDLQWVEPAEGAVVAADQVEASDGDRESDDSSSATLPLSDYKGPSDDGGDDTTMMMMMMKMMMKMKMTTTTARLTITLMMSKCTARMRPFVDTADAECLLMRSVWRVFDSDGDVSAQCAVLYFR